MNGLRPHALGGQRQRAGDGRVRHMPDVVRQRQRDIELGVGRALGAEFLQRRRIRLATRLLHALVLLRAMPVRQPVRQRHLLRDEQ